MNTFDLKKFLTENKLTSNSRNIELNEATQEELYRFRQYRTEESSVNEGILQDLGDKAKPALSKVFSIGKSKSKQVYDIVKKEIKDPENAQKALDIVSKAYNGIKNVADKATSNPEDLKAISKFIPPITASIIGSSILAVYKIWDGTDIVLPGLKLSWEDIKKLDVVEPGSAEFGDPSVAITIGAILVTLKLVMYALQAIADLRKGTGAIKRMFNENEEAMTDVDFSDIEGIFELKLQ